MPNWGAILAGLGRGASTLGDTLETRKAVTDRDRRQQAQDALSELLKFEELGASDVSGQADPLAALRLGQLDGNPLAAVTGGPSLTQRRDEQRQFGDPRVVTIPGPDGRMRQILLDPSKGKEARTELRQQRMLERKPPAPARNIDRLSAEGQAAEIALAKGLQDVKPSADETFGAPFSANQDGQAGMFERGNRGTIRRVQGMTPYQAPAREAGPSAAERGQSARTAATYKQTKTTMDNLKDAISTYRGQLGASGVEILPGDQKSLLESSYANLMLQAKEAAKLGVLAGPDMAILESLVNDPTTMGSAVKNVLQLGGRSKSIEKQLAQYESIIDGYIARNEQNYNANAKGTAADRWEELVKGGMDKAKATAQVKREFPDG